MSDTHHEHENGHGELSYWSAFWVGLFVAAVVLFTGLSVEPEKIPRLWLALIPLMPAFGALFNGIFVRHMPKLWTVVIAVGAPIVSFVFSVFLFFWLKKEGMEYIDVTLYEWLSAGAFSLDVTFRLDALSGVMILVVSGVGSLIHVYSIGYIAHDSSHNRFFTYLNLFTFAMLVLVLGNSMPLTFIGWEGVGLCSYLLIGFWFEDHANASAGKKAFIVNRIGDVGVLLGMFLIFQATGTLVYEEIAANMDKILNPTTVTVFGAGTATAIGLLLFLGCTGKSAQIPLYVWLPDAMAGPTPVSALIHAATMVTAGVYLIARMNFLYVATPEAMTVVAIVGALTALFAATIGLFQYDIKKVLAYSTVSQLGYMFLAVGVGAFTAGIFHLMTHAFFKACLFLGSGSVIHGMHEEQDIRKMGGLAKFMPKTHWTFFISCIAIAGLPPLAAFFSKDEILWHAFANKNVVVPWLPNVLWLIGAIAAGFTAFYMFRLYFLTFRGECRAPAALQKKIHESPPSMTWPLIILSGLAIVGGWVGMPAIFHVPNLFHENLHHVLSYEGLILSRIAPESEHAWEWIMMLTSVAIACAGIALAWVIYGKKPDWKWQPNDNFVYQMIHNKYWVDEGYFYAFVRPLVNFSVFLWRMVDAWIIDGALTWVTSAVAYNVGQGIRIVQTGNVQTYLLSFVIGVSLLVFYLWRFVG